MIYEKDVKVNRILTIYLKLVQGESVNTTSIFIRKI